MGTCNIGVVWGLDNPYSIWYDVHVGQERRPNQTNRTFRDDPGRCPLKLAATRNILRTLDTTSPICHSDVVGPHRAARRTERNRMLPTFSPMDSLQIQTLALECAADRADRLREAAWTLAVLRQVEEDQQAR